MVCIDTADTAKEVLRLFCVPLVERELVFAFHNAQLVDGNAGHYCAFPPAERAITASELFQAVVQLYFEFDRSTVARAFPDFHCHTPFTLTIRPHTVLPCKGNFPYVSLDSPFLTYRIAASKRLCRSFIGRWRLPEQKIHHASFGL
jgi:hypothetical protein